MSVIRYIIPMTTYAFITHTNQHKPILRGIQKKEITINFLNETY